MRQSIQGSLAQLAISAIPGLLHAQTTPTSQEVTVFKEQGELIHGTCRLQVYSPAGRLLYATQNAMGGKAASTTNYIYLHHGLIAEVNQ